MQPPLRITHSKASPGLVDRPGPRRPSAIVTQEKAEKQQAAELKAEESRRRVARVSELEREVRKAQTEAKTSKQGRKGEITKKTFPRMNGDTGVSFPDLYTSTCSLILCRQQQVTTINQGKRDADSADLSDPEVTKIKKISKYVARSGDPSFGSLNGYHRVTKLGPNKPSGLAGPVKVIHPASTTDEDDETGLLTEDEEVADDPKFATKASNDSLVSPPACHLATLALTIFPCRSVSHPHPQPLLPLPHLLKQGRVFGHSPGTSSDHFLKVSLHVSSLRWAVLHLLGQNWMPPPFKVM